uniref:Uncharacterized protein n=1 Tax=Avena sativa TaxID=4498 RepID=A0ACD5UIB2_AVESA
MANVCTKLTGTVHSVRLFQIDGFTLVAKTMSTTECIKSRWNVDGYEWKIQCYPAYYDPHDWVDFKLMFLGEARSSNVRASLGCLLIHPRIVSHVVEKTVSHVFKRPKDCSAGISLLRPGSSLPVPASLKDDYLTVQCTITIVKELPELQPAPAPRRAPEQRDRVRHHIRCIR